MEPTKPFEATPEQIQEWKNKHGKVYKIIAEDGKVGYIKDPFSDIKIMKMAAQQLSKSDILFVQTILTNCWLDGDNEIQTDESYCNGLKDQVKEIADVPECLVERSGSLYSMTSEGITIKVRAAKRGDVIMADQKNGAKEAFESGFHLLKIIAIDEVALKELQSNTRAYLGVVCALEKVKDKVVMRVEKL